MLVTLCFFLSLAAWAGPADPGAKLAEQSAQALDVGDTVRAFELAAKAIKRAPDSGAAWRAMLFAALELESQLEGSPKDELGRLILGAAQRVVALRPDMTAVGIAQTTLDGRVKPEAGALAELIEPSPTCTPAGLDALGRAERAFSKRDMPTARAAYDEAIPACNPPTLAAGARHALQAVACNPSYDAGWATLLVYVEAGDKTLRPRWTPSEDPRFWSSYKAAIQGTGGLEPRVAAVRKLLVTQPPQGWLAGALRDADAAGLLEAAILVDLLDADLVNVMLAERVARLDQLAEVVRRYHIVPK